MGSLKLIESRCHWSEWERQLGVQPRLEIAGEELPEASYEITVRSGSASVSVFYAREQDAIAVAAKAHRETGLGIVVSGPHAVPVRTVLTLPAT